MGKVNNTQKLIIATPNQSAYRLRGSLLFKTPHIFPNRKEINQFTNQ